MTRWDTVCRQPPHFSSVSLTAGADAWAQATAQISGDVTDQSGGVLPGVTVTATQTQTGAINARPLLDLPAATRYKRRSWQAQSIYARG